MKSLRSAMTAALYRTYRRSAGVRTCVVWRLRGGRVAPPRGFRLPSPLMARINEHYAKLPARLSVPRDRRRVRAYQAAHPDARVIRLGIGDVTEPSPPPRSSKPCTPPSMRWPTATPSAATAPSRGYEFLIEAIREHDFAARGVHVGADEIFVSDGSKCDSGNIQEIFAHGARIAVTDPVYPVYVDSNVMAGRTGPAGADGRYAGLTYLVGNEANGFQPDPPAEPVDFVYLCSPNNPTGTVASRPQLERWGRLGARQRRRHPVRRRLRGLHLRPGAPPLDLRDRRRARLRD